MGRLLLVLAAVVVALVSAAPAEAAAPALRPISLAPLTLRGTGFQAGERVRVTLTIRTVARRTTLRAGAAGRFTYRPEDLVAVDPCRGTIVVTALGLSSGRRAGWKHVCRPPDVWPAHLWAGGVTPFA
jgi:hypothetical protein